MGWKLILDREAILDFKLSENQCGMETVTTFGNIDVQSGLSENQCGMETGYRESVPDDGL